MRVISAGAVEDDFSLADYRQTLAASSGLGEPERLEERARG